MTVKDNLVTIEGYDNYRLVKNSDVFPPQEEGFSIDLFIGHDDMNFDIVPFEIGLFRPNGQDDAIVDLTTKLANAIGKENRSLFNTIMNHYTENFPANSDGIGPYLNKMGVFYHDGQGNKFLMEPVNLEEVENV